MHSRNFLFDFRTAALAVVAVLFLSACGDPAEEATQDVNGEASEEQEQIIEALQSMQTDLFREAFASIPQYRHTRYLRTEQWTPEPRVINRKVSTREFDIGGREISVTVRDSLGAFARDRAPGFIASGDVPLTTLPTYILPDDPAYLEPRYQESFIYAQHADTTLWGHSARVFEVRAREDSREDQAIRSAKFYLLTDSDELVKLHIQRVDDGLLFGENTTLDMALRPLNDTWVPSLLRAHTAVGTLFRDNQIFRTVVALYDFQRE